MKEYFYEKDNKTYIIDDEKGIIIEDSKENTEEILITQNNIEEIELEIKTSNEDKQTLIDLEENRRPQSVAITIVCVISIAMILWIGLEKSPIHSLLVSSIFFVQPIINIIECFDFKKKSEIYDKYIKELEIEIKKEKQKLKNLRKNAKNKTINYTVIKKVTKSDIIKNLSSKKDLINDYINNRKKYITLYKEGLLNSLLQTNNYDARDMEFINYLIQEELKNENTNSNKKTKQKTL